MAGMKRLGAVMGLASMLSGCALLDQFLQMSAFAKCQFRLVSVDNPVLAGFPISGKKTVRDFGLRDGIRFTAAVSGNRLPLSFTLNLEAKNPNTQVAAMNRLAWILLVDGIEMTRGQVEQRVEVPANGTAPLPLAIELDLRQVMTGQSLEAMLNLAFNVAGEGAHPTRITLKARPSIIVGGQTLDFPDYITVNAEYGREASK